LKNAADFIIERIEQFEKIADDLCFLVERLDTCDKVKKFQYLDNKFWIVL